MSYLELSRQAGALRKAKDFAAAMPLYKEIIEDYTDECNEYDWWGYSQCLLKLDIYEEALRISREGLLLFRESSYLRTVYTWSLYHLRIKPEPVTDRDAFFKAANAIVKLSPADDKYSPLAITVFTVIDLLELDYDENVQQILAWITKLNPEKLSRVPFSFLSHEGKEIENASDFEKYHAILVKAQLETGRYNECIADATYILQEIKRFHHGYDVWIRRQRALAYYKTGKFSESLADYLLVLEQKQDWFLKMELAEVYLAAEDRGKALIYALDAADYPGVSKMKVNLYLLIANLFLDAGKHYEAAVHARLVNSLRTREGWSDEQDAWEILGRTTQVTGLPEDFSALMKLAEKIWAENQPKQERSSGTIKSLLPGGNAGFIAGDDGIDYYFRTRDIRDNLLNPKPGLKVSFLKSEGFDSKKNKPSVIATDLIKG